MNKVMFGAGCFWGVQFYFDQVPGVTKTLVGYSGGHTENPTYEDVCSHTTGHAEVVYLEYDEEKVSFETLLKQFFRMHDPTQLNRQGPDIGDNYRSVIYFYNSEQQKLAEKIRDETQNNFEDEIVTEIDKAKDFYVGEDYHQKYAEKTGRGICHVEYSPVA
ncbi:MAG: peptide-methionine (S)-S-oxide reductase MsrA [bacterium]